MTLRTAWVWLLVAQTVAPYAQEPSTWLDSLVESLPTYRRHIAAAPGDFELQVLYRALDGPEAGETLGYGLAPQRYFYPASTVKLPVAALALQHVNELGVLGLDADSPMEVGVGVPPQTASRTRVGMADTPATILGHVRDIAIVSSNEAYNRLYEWIGPRYIHEQLHLRGWTGRIATRLGEQAFAVTDNYFLNPVAFRNTLRRQRSDTVYYRGPALTGAPPLRGVSGLAKGRGYYDDATQRVVREPFDFSQKNFVPLGVLADVLQAIVLPETVDSLRRFRMREADRFALLEALRTRPADSDNPLHHDKPDGYVNFLYYGGGGDWEAGGPVIYNKVGDAYGYLTDVAVFEDARTGRRYLLAATIHVNANGVYNDGVYEYEEIGLPFLRELGRAVWARG